MVVQYTRYIIAENRTLAFLDAHRKAIQHLQFRCVRYELTHCSEEREWYTLRIEWDSREELRRFTADAAGNAFLQAVGGFTRDVQEQRQWELTDVVHTPMATGSGMAEGYDTLPCRSPWNRLYPWILEHLQRKILVEQMAERVNMSPRNFARVFRHEFRVPPGEFLDRVRVAAAKSDLEDNTHSIEQIALSKGFGSSSTMRRVFLRILRITPSEYRDQVRMRSRASAVMKLEAAQSYLFPIPGTLAAFDSCLVQPSGRSAL